MGTSTVGSGSVMSGRVADLEIKRFLGEKWDVIEHEFAPLHFIVFGSRVNGIPHEWSDIDAIIVSNRFASIPQVNRGFEFKCIVEPDIGMDILCYTPEEFERMRTGIGIVPDACREGLWLK